MAPRGAGRPGAGVDRETSHMYMCMYMSHVCDVHVGAGPARERRGGRGGGGEGNIEPNPSRIGASHRHRPAAPAGRQYLSLRTSLFR